MIEIPVLGILSSSRFKLIVDPNCYITKWVQQGIPDSRRPNGRKMLYKWVRIIIPKICRRGDMIICHPSIEEKVRQILDQSPIIV